MIWLYRLLFLPALLLALPYYLLRMWRRGGYGKDFKHRFGFFHCLPRLERGRCRIWLQAVSVGEVLAVGPLIEALQARKDVEIVLTTTTSTGYAEARKRYGQQVLQIGIFPLDFWLFSRLAWNRIQPDAVVLTEGELWPEHLHQAQSRQVSAFLVNARLSERSFRRYSRGKVLVRRLLAKLEAAYAASHLDRDRFIELGIRSDKVASLGSIKFDVPLGAPITIAQRQALRAELGLDAGNIAEPPFVLIGASTWPGEEAALVEVLQSWIDAGRNCALILVPRHAERGAELAEWLSQQTLTWHQRSKASAPLSAVRICLADTTGELTCLIQAADLAFIGKSLAPNEGGQTPIEAAGLGVPVVMGPNMSNFRAVSKSLLESGAARQVHSVLDLESTLTNLLEDASGRAAMAAAGQAWHRRNRGSSQRIAEAIRASVVPN